MDKNELTKLKKTFKYDNSGALQILAMNHSYLKQREGSMEQIFNNCVFFDSKDESVQEKYFNNYKKLLTGKFSQKLFELEFNVDEGGDVQTNLYEMLEDDNFEDSSKELIDRLLEKINYGTDVLITTILGQAYLQKSKKKEEGDADNETYHRFIFCTVNKIEATDKELELDITKKDLIEQSSSMVANFNKPVEGFMFPTINDFKADVNKILYCSTKANYINTLLTNEILKCDEILTAKAEKEIFNNVLKDTVGDTISLENISNIYKSLGDIKEEVKDGSISIEDLGDLLEGNGIEDAKSVLLKMPVEKDTKIAIDNLIPTGSKGIKISNSSLTVSVGTNSISNIEKSIIKGKKCLVIELTEDVVIDEFKVI